LRLFSFSFKKKELKELEGNTKVNSKVDKGAGVKAQLPLHMKAPSSLLFFSESCPPFSARTFLNAFTVEINKKSSMLWTSVEKKAKAWKNVCYHQISDDSNVYFLTHVHVLPVSSKGGLNISRCAPKGLEKRTWRKLHSETDSCLQGLLQGGCIRTCTSDKLPIS
jgi:hypothetical protein